MSDSGVTVEEGGSSTNANLMSEGINDASENVQRGNQAHYGRWRRGWRHHPDRKGNLPLQPDSEVATSELGSEQQTTGTGDASGDMKGPNQARHEHSVWRHGWRHHPPPEWKESIPMPSDADIFNSDITAEEKERFARYKRWEMYWAQRFPGPDFPPDTDFKGQGEHPHAPGNFDGPFPHDQPFPFYSPYHRHHFHCGGRFNGPKPTLQERLQREFDFV